jgi:NAD(P)-dependent dehydrogenase (short-subunit alcohol dehydrogenase family)
MVARGSGCIINVGSITGTRTYLPITATSVAKTALIRFGEGLAAQLERHSVRVFTIHPGVVRTRLLESYGLQIPEDWFVGPERAGALCVKLASGRYDALSGLFLGIDDDLEGLLRRVDEIKKRELYCLRLST